MVIYIDWIKVREGDKKVFDRLFDLHYLPLCEFVSRYIKDKSVIEDIVIECYAKIWENRQTLNIKTSFQNYLVTMVKNSAISYLRKNQFLFSDFENVSNSIVEDDTDPLEDAELLINYMKRSIGSQNCTSSKQSELFWIKNKRHFFFKFKDKLKF